MHPRSAYRAARPKVHSLFSRIFGGACDPRAQDTAIERVMPFRGTTVRLKSTGIKLLTWRGPVGRRNIGPYHLGRRRSGSRGFTYLRSPGGRLDTEGADPNQRGGHDRIDAKPASPPYLPRFALRAIHVSHEFLDRRAS